MGARCSSWVCFIPATRPRQACPQQHAAEKHLFHHRRFPSLGKQRTTARQLHCLRTSVGPPLTKAAHDAYTGPDEWLTTVQPVEGSWWTEWTRWLGAKSGEPAPPPPMGIKPAAGKSLPNAPGDYVRQ